MNRWSFVPAAVGLCLVGCVSEQNFNLSVQKDLVVRVKPGSAETLKVAPGNYAMNLSVGELTSKITLSSSKGEKIVFRSKTLKDLRDEFKSNESSSSVISAAQLQQTFDVQLIKQKKKTSTGAEVSKSESCVSGYHTEYEQRCTPGQTSCYGGHEVCHQRHGTNGDERSDFDCHTEGENCYTEAPNCYTEPVQVPEYGSREVRGRTNSYVTTTQFRLLQDGAVKASAQPQSVSFNEWEETYSGSCY